MTRARRSATIGIATAIIGLICTLIPPLVRLEESAGLSWLYRARGPVPPPSQVVVVSLDEAASAHFGLPPLIRDWPRSAYASLVERLVERGAVAIALDVQCRRTTLDLPAKNLTRDGLIEPTRWNRPALTIGWFARCELDDGRQRIGLDQTARLWHRHSRRRGGGRNRTSDRLRVFGRGVGHVPLYGVGAILSRCRGPARRFLWPRLCRRSRHCRGDRSSMRRISSESCSLRRHWSSRRENGLGRAFLRRCTTFWSALCATGAKTGTLILTGSPLGRGQSFSTRSRPRHRRSRRTKTTTVTRVPCQTSLTRRLCSGRLLK